jgi:hypothetical protein
MAQTQEQGHKQLFAVHFFIVSSSLFLFVAPGTSASRLDVTGICHSRVHAETRQQPPHQHDVCRKKRNEP